MSGVQPFFITGANAKIRLNNVTLAYCTNVQYTIAVNHASPVLLGMYEPASLEPLSYKVTGSFTVIRYVADAADKIGSAPDKASKKGNGIGYWGPDGFFKKLIGGLNPSGADGRPYDSFNPAKLDKAAMFSMEILQKLSNGETMSLANIRDCRITQAALTMNKAGAVTQTFNFSALYVDEDSFKADFSGFGQQFD